eukprot:7701305-Pyramimonas_sp.AAC.1
MSFAGLSVLFYHYAGRRAELRIAKSSIMQICAPAYAQLHWRLSCGMQLGRAMATCGGRGRQEAKGAGLRRRGGNST